MIKILLIFVLMLILAMPATAANVTKVEIHGVVFDQSLSSYNTTSNLLWDAQKFPGFYYNFAGGKSGETLNITQDNSTLKSTSRAILKDNLFYNTSRRDSNYTVYTEKGYKVENGLQYLRKDVN